VRLPAVQLEMYAAAAPVSSADAWTPQPWPAEATQSVSAVLDNRMAWLEAIRRACWPLCVLDSASSPP